MKVFISWSGQLSRDLGEALSNWLPLVIQRVEPYFTPDDIEKGRRWSSEIAAVLESARVGIFCVTRDNHEKPWLMFEAGAISKVSGSIVCSVLFNIRPTDLQSPLTQFQMTEFGKSDMLKLVQTINRQLEEPRLREEILNKTFETNWPELEAKVEAILSRHHATEGQSPPIRNERELLEEVLQLTRSLSSGAVGGPAHELAWRAAADQLFADIERVVSKLKKNPTLPRNYLAIDIGGILRRARKLVEVTAPRRADFNSIQVAIDSLIESAAAIVDKYEPPMGYKADGP